MTAESVIEGIKAVGAIITPIAVAYVAVIASRTHKAVNSTATILAAEKKADQERILNQEATIAKLRAEASAAHQAIEVREARAMPPAAP